MKLLAALLLSVIMAGGTVCAADAPGTPPDATTTAPVVPAWCAGGWSGTDPNVHDIWFTKTGAIIFLVGPDRDVVEADIIDVRNASTLKDGVVSNGLILVRTNKFIVMIEKIGDDIRVTIMTKEGNIPLGTFSHAAPKDPGNIG